MSRAAPPTVRAGVRETLRGRLRRSPLDFIREMRCPEGDCELWLDEITRPVSPDHDLALVVDLPGAGSTAVLGAILPWDTKFFGFTVARLDAVLPLADPGYQVLADLQPAVAALIARALDLKVRYLFAPVDARDMGLARALTSKGFALIESRLYSHRSLADFSPRHRHDARLATADDVEPLADVAATMVNAYDRFHSDPLLVGDQADRLMREWVAASLRGGFADATMVPNVPQPGAFLTIKHHREKWPRWGLAIGQAPFGAVSPAFKGWYVRLISEICLHLREIGAEHFYMATQATNNAVVHGWEQLGLRYGKNELILRIAL